MIQHWFSCRKHRLSYGTCRRCWTTGLPTHSWWWWQASLPCSLSTFTGFTSEWSARSSTWISSVRRDKNFSRRCHAETQVDFSLSAAMLLCFHPLISLIGIFHSCSCATNEYNAIAFSLHNITSDSVNDHALLSRVERFSLQLMTTRMQFTARGFFEMSNKTLREVSWRETLES